MSDAIKLRIIHETNPRKYFPALYELADDKIIDLVGEHRYSIVKEWLRSWLRDKTTFSARTKNAYKDLLLRFKVPFITDETIVMGFAPWDWRILIFRSLANRNKILYQTSWHDWRLDKTPRQPKPNYIKRWLQKQWHTFVRHPNVNVIAVTPTVADTVLQQTGVSATIIPHAVPEVFFKAGSERKPKKNKSLKLLYVGEISEKKGIKVLLNMLKELNCDDISLTVVGNGPLVTLVKGSAHNVTYLGPIYDRSKLATVMSQHDVLMLLSQKTPTWEELFGIVIVEAIAAGCVVIASDHIGPRGIFAGTEQVGLFKENDIDNIKTTIHKLKDFSDFFSKFKRQQDVSRKFSVEIVKSDWERGLTKWK